MRVTDKIDLGILAQTPLFSNMTLDEIEEATAAIRCAVISYPRGAIVMHSGDSTETSSLVMKGRANIFTAPDLDGNQRIIVNIGIGEMYGEPFNCLSYSAVPITVKATTDLKVLTLDIQSIYSVQCSESIARRLFSNLAIQLAEKIIVFRNKVEVLSQPTLETKMLATIKQYAEYHNTFEPIIPFSKTEWGDYPNANRNSITRSLKRLEREGYVRVEGKRYHLLKTDNVMFIQRSVVSPQNAVHAKVTSEDNLDALRRRKGSAH